MGDVPIGASAGDRIEVDPELMGQVPDRRSGTRMRGRSTRCGGHRLVVVDSVG